MNVADMVQVLSHQDSTHASGALLRLNDLRREGILCDLTIKVEGREYKAHKAVMAACSDYFLNAICGGKTTATVTPGDHGCVTVDLDHVTLRGFAPLLEYAYTTNLQVNASDVIDVLSAASYMQMFKVANACSEFMRSNILWGQSRLASLPGLPQGYLNGSNQLSSERTSSPVPSSHRAAGFPPDVSSLLKATAASRVALGQPPLLIPMHSLAYDVGIQQLAATMAGRSIISSSTADQSRSTPPTSSSPCPRKLTQSPSLWTPASCSAGEKPSSKSADITGSDLSYNARSSTGHAKGGRKSLAVKIETRTDDEDSHSSLNDMDGNAKIESVSPTESEPMEDSWQAIQKMYSLKGQQNTESDSQFENRHCYPPRTLDSAGNRNHTSRSPFSHDRKNACKELQSMEFDGNHQQISASINSEDTNKNNNNNNNSNNSSCKNDLNDYINAMAAKSRYQGLEKSPPSLFPGKIESPHSPEVAAAAFINGAMRNAFLQQQQRAKTTQSMEDSGKHVVLPSVPPNGQYMSVRRRTLQSTVPKPHQCQICGSRFTRFHNLKQHIKLHSGIKPYECDQCGKRFTRNYTLRLHKMKHVGIRNFRCGTCDASFTSSGEFRAHLRLTMHSHLSGTSLHGHQSPRASNSEPEDLSTQASLISALGSGGKYSRCDSSVPNFQRGFFGDRVSLLTAALGGSMMAADGGGSAGSSCGEGSPRMSDRSISPQDLSTKSFNKREEEREGTNADLGGNFQGDKREEAVTTQSTNDEICPVQESAFHTSNNTSEKEQRDASEDEERPAVSPTQEMMESSSSEKEVSDQYVGNPVSDGKIDRDDNNPNAGNVNDRPLSLVVNASA